MSRVSNVVATAVACAALTTLMLATAHAIGRSAQTESKGNPEARTLKNPVPANAESAAAGQQVFRKYCRFCHGDEAKGDGPQAPKGSHPANLTDDTWDHGSSDGEIYTVIRDGPDQKSVMKPYKSKLTDKELWSLVNYLRSLASTTKKD